MSDSAVARAGSEDLLASVWRANVGRMPGDGVAAADMIAGQKQITRWEDWFAFWAKTGDRYEELAREALRLGRRLSAGELLWRASLSYQYAQFLWFHDDANRVAGQHRKVELYREAAPLFAISAERFDIPFEGFTIPGYLRVPPGAGPAPVALLLGGLESTKEESYLFENMCLQRGLATCTFDGPGQGEMYFQARLRPDFHRFASPVVDWLETRPEVDTSRLGVLGRSLGGYYAIHCAAHDPRFKACVCWGVLYDLSYFDRIHEPTRFGFSYVAGYAHDVEAGKGYLQATVNLDGQAERVRCAVYALHGAQDDLIPVSTVDRLRQALKDNPDVTYDIPADGNHCCHNLAHIVRPRMADWLAERLGGRT